MPLDKKAQRIVQKYAVTFNHTQQSSKRGDHAMSTAIENWRHLRGKQLIYSAERAIESRQEWHDLNRRRSGCNGGPPIIGSRRDRSSHESTEEYE